MPFSSNGPALSKGTKMERYTPPHWLFVGLALCCILIAAAGSAAADPPTDHVSAESMLLFAGLALPSGPSEPAVAMGPARSFDPLAVTAPALSPRPQSVLLKTWVPLTVAELALLGVTASLPKKWTCWSANFVQDGINNFGEAYTKPPVWDTDHWFHNYLGHPYGGSAYYNAVRSRGATVPEAAFFTVLLSTQWEYIFEALAERPSIQDLVITPVAGSLLGELTHRTALRLKRNGTTPLERVALLVINPMHVLFAGFGEHPARIEPP
jgi:hypothetical protein